jgi:hypothetical protein
MDVHELRIATEWAKCLKMENVDLDTKLHSQEDNLKESTETIECLQLSI